MDNKDPNLQQPNQTTQADQAVPAAETPQEHPAQDLATPTDQAPHTDQAAPQEAAPSENVSPESQTPPPPPVIPTQPVAPTTPPTAPVVEKKSNSLVLVAGILITLIAVLGVLYFIILKQSSSPATSVPVKTQTAVKPTTPPVTPTVTPTDDQILNSQVSDPSQDATQLNQDAQGL